jgi:hypothetical protein
LYPLVYPPYPKINTLKENGKEYKVAQFYLAFFKQEYLLKLPLDVAFRLIENAVKAPEEVALLEEKIRPIKDIWKPENRRKQQVESPEFLLMLESELTKIETKIKEKIRPIKDIWKPENRRKQQVESPEFLLMLESELTKIETKIKEKESRIEQ